MAAKSFGSGGASSKPFYHGSGRFSGSKPYYHDGVCPVHVDDSGGLLKPPPRDEYGNLVDGGKNTVDLGDVASDPKPTLSDENKSVMLLTEFRLRWPQIVKDLNGLLPSGLEQRPNPSVASEPGRRPAAAGINLQWQAWSLLDVRVFVSTNMPTCEWTPSRAKFLARLCYYLTAERWNNQKGESSAQSMMVCLPTLLFYTLPRGSKGPSLTNLVLSRCRKFISGDWHTLVQEWMQARQMWMDERSGGRKSLTQEFQNKNTADRAKRHMSKGYVARASRALNASVMAAGNAETFKALHELHPPEADIDKEWSAAVDGATVDPISIRKSLIVRAIRAGAKGSSGRCGGTRYPHLRLFLGNKKMEEWLHLFVNMCVQGKEVTPDLRYLLRPAHLLALSKPKGGIRPIAIGSIFRRVISRAVAYAIKVKAATYFRPLQFGVAIERGVEVICTAVDMALARSEGRYVAVSADAKNGFNSISRHAILEQLKKEFPELLPWLGVCYGSPAELYFHFDDGTIQVLWSRRGTQQGDPLGSFLFSLAFHPVLRTFNFDVKKKHRELRGGSAKPEDEEWKDGFVGGFCDDLNAIVHRDLHLWAVARFAGLAYDECELVLSLRKHQSYVQVPPLAAPGAYALTDQELVLVVPHCLRQGFWMEGQDGRILKSGEKTRLPASTDGIVILGAPIGREEFVQQHLRKTTAKARKMLALLPLLDEAHYELTILRLCISQYGGYLLRVTRYSAAVQRWAAEFDLALLDGFTSLLGEARLSASQLQQIGLAPRHGGFGIRPQRRIGAAAAYSCRVASVKSLHGQCEMPNFAKGVLGLGPGGANDQDAALEQSIFALKEMGITLGGPTGLPVPEEVLRWEPPSQLQMGQGGRAFLAVHAPGDVSVRDTDTIQKWLTAQLDELALYHTLDSLIVKAQLGNTQAGMQYQRVLDGRGYLSPWILAMPKDVSLLPSAVVRCLLRWKLGLPPTAQSQVAFCVCGQPNDRLGQHIHSRCKKGLGFSTIRRHNYVVRKLARIEQQATGSYVEHEVTFHHPDQPIQGHKKTIADTVFFEGLRKVATDVVICDMTTVGRTTGAQARKGPMRPLDAVIEMAQKKRKRYEDLLKPGHPMAGMALIPVAMTSGGTVAPVTRRYLGKIIGKAATCLADASGVPVTVYHHRLRMKIALALAAAQGHYMLTRARTLEALVHDPPKPDTGLCASSSPHVSGTAAGYPSMYRGLTQHSFDLFRDLSNAAMRRSFGHVDFHMIPGASHMSSVQCQTGLLLAARRANADNGGLPGGDLGQDASNPSHPAVPIMRTDAGGAAIQRTRPGPIDVTSYMLSVACGILDEPVLVLPKALAAIASNSSMAQILAASRKLKQAAAKPKPTLATRVRKRAASSAGAQGSRKGAARAARGTGRGKGLGRGRGSQ